MRMHRHKAQIKPRRGRSLQAAGGVSHRDLVVQRKKWCLFTSVPFTNSTGAFSYGITNTNVSVTGAGIANAVYDQLMTLASQTYEEYRIRRVVLRAQPGLGYTNDRRIKSSIFARVDVNSQPTIVNLDNLNSVIASESSVNRTLSERSNVVLADYRPICFSTGGIGASSRPILPGAMQWYNIDERGSHLWRGATVAPVIPDTSFGPNELAMTVWVEVEMDFRSRRPEFENLSGLELVDINETENENRDFLRSPDSGYESDDEMSTT